MECFDSDCDTKISVFCQDLTKNGSNIYPQVVRSISELLQPLVDVVGVECVVAEAEVKGTSILTNDVI